MKSGSKSYMAEVTLVDGTKLRIGISGPVSFSYNLDNTITETGSQQDGVKIDIE